MPTRPAPKFALLIAVGAALAGCSNKEPAATDAGTAATAPASAPAAAPAPAALFDLATVPLSTATLPAFPYLDWPADVPAGERRTDLQKSLDQATLVAGAAFRQVEGQIERRGFSIPSSTSQFAVRRHYADLVKSLGGVQINQFNPVNVATATISAPARALAGPDADVAQLLGLQRYDEGQYEYESYVIRTEAQNVWVVVQTSQYSAVVTVISEKAATPAG